MPVLKKIIHNCKRATFLVEKKLTVGLTLRERAELRIHLYTCSVCRIFDKQSQMINQMVQQLFKSSNDSSIRLDDDSKQQLQQRIEQELNKN